jgi:hypothetical protein
LLSSADARHAWNTAMLTAVSGMSAQFRQPEGRSFLLEGVSIFVVRV